MNKTVNSKMENNLEKISFFTEMSMKSLGHIALLLMSAIVYNSKRNVEDNKNTSKWAMILGMFLILFDAVDVLCYRIKNFAADLED